MRAERGPTSAEGWRVTSDGDEGPDQSPRIPCEGALSTAQRGRPPGGSVRRGGGPSRGTSSGPTRRRQPPKCQRPTPAEQWRRPCSSARPPRTVRACQLDLRRTGLPDLPCPPSISYQYRPTRRVVGSSWPRCSGGWRAWTGGMNMSWVCSATWRPTAASTAAGRESCSG